MSLATMQRISTPASTTGRSAQKHLKMGRSLAGAALPVRLAVPRTSKRSAQAPSAHRGGRWDSNYGYRNFGGPFIWQDSMTAAAQLAELAQKFAASQAGTTNGSNSSSTNPLSRFLPVDMEEQEDKFMLTADVPGLQKSDLKITINQKDRSLKLSGERARAKPVKAEGESEEKSTNNFRKQFERPMGKFSRTISGLPEEADLSSVSARVDKGVLTITIQKAALPEFDSVFEIDVE